MHDHGQQLETPGLKFALSGVSALYNHKPFNKRKVQNSYWYSHFSLVTWQFLIEEKQRLIV